ncbi:MSC_0620 family F1-like ATPase-associated subunit [[Mycoplasma] gypis]|uniref:Uncharacterized protein n=1 Tax=[Mycoplasma] gypis TaxID=92404 RepID=A0ABZ2RMK6_9BACT|nr:hypothetical protein [[Mycoplasma] gypis]MBN0919020.1 hypothetical protein [[Mycoplasma] gypis]
MKKNKKLFLSIGPVLATPVLALTFLSADTNVSNNGEENPENPAPAVSDPEFSTFSSKMDAFIHDSLSEFIDSSISEVNRRINKLLEIEDENFNKQLLVKVLYYKKLAAFFKDNKDAILKNPQQYGFNIVFPRILSDDANYFHGEITYQSQTFDNIIIGNKAPNDYSNQINSENGSITKSQDQTLNTIDWKNLSETGNKYFSQLSGEFEKIFTSPDDLPDESVKIINPEKGFIDIEAPSGFASWNQYLISKISPRFTLFDLQQNQDFNDKHKEEEPQAEIPPLLPEEKTLEDPIESDVVQNISRLNPYIDWQFLNSSNSDLINPVNINQHFWFNNPIYTRFEYKVLEVKEESGQLVAKIQLSDRLKPEKINIYKKPVVRFTSVQVAKTTQLAYYIIQKTFKRLYDALGVGSNIELLKLRSNNLANSVYKMIQQAIKLTNNSTFKFNVNAIINNYTSLVGNQNFSSLEDGYNKLKNTNFAHDIDSLFTTALKISLINNAHYWQFLSNAFNNLFYAMKENIISVESYVKENLKNSNHKIENLETALNVLRDDINIFSGIAKTSTFDANAQYNSIIAIINKIHTQFLNIGTITINKDIDFGSDNAEATSYNNAFKELQYNSFLQPDSSKHLLTGSAIAVAILALFFGFVAVMLKVFKNKKINNEKNKIIISSVISITSLVVAIILLVLAIGVL